MDFDKKSDRNANIVNKKYPNNLSVSRDVIKKERNDVSVTTKGKTEIFKLLDLGGMPITLQYQGKLTYTSSLGGIISLITLGIMVFYLIIALSYFLGRKDPIYSSTPEFNTIPKAIFLNKFSSEHDLIAGIKIELPRSLEDTPEIREDYVLLNDPTIISYSINHTTTYENSDHQTQLKHIKVDCHSSPSFTKQKNGRSFYELNNLDKAICFRLDYFTDSNNKTQPVNLQGNEFSQIESLIEIVVRPCKNQTDSTIVCKPLDVIKKYVKTASFNFFYNQRNFMINDTIISPITNSTGNKKFNIQGYFHKKLELYVRNNSVMNQYDYIQMAKPQYILTFAETNLDIDFVSESEFGM